MKYWAYRVAVVTALCAGIWSCASSNAQLSGTSHDDLSTTPVYLEPGLERIDQYLDMAEHSDDASDDPSYCYQRAFEILDSLSAYYSGDLAFAEADARVNESYDNYQTQSGVSAEDSLTMFAIIDDLNEIYDQVEDSALGEVVVDTDTIHQIPIELNKKVENAITYFSKGRGRRVFQRWLERAGHYESLVKGILREENAPEELFYLAMIESGLRPSARSYAKAVGMWQFIYRTGKAYGLNSSWWYDDRRDPVKASRAAARHLLDLRERFDDWYIGIAGYNFSPGKIASRIKRHNVDNFWDLPRLPKQTRNYVPTFLAAVTIASNPEAYGFGDIVPMEPIGFDTVTVRECVDMNVVAEILGTTYTEMKSLNPALLRWCTPPDVDMWLLNIPVGTRDTFVAKYDEIPKEKKVSWAHHRVRSGETLSTIARRYRVSVSEIRRFNNISGSLIRIGQNIVIPVPQNKKYYSNYVAAESTPPRPSVKKSIPADVPGRTRRIHEVRSGDSLWELAQAYGVTLTQIREWNGLGYSRLIKPGQKLNIWLSEGSVETIPSPLLARVDATSSQPAAAESEASTGNASQSQKTLMHTVRSGDTLWEIAQAYSVSISDIKRWNGKTSNTIRPGDELKIVID